MIRICCLVSCVCIMFLLIESECKVMMCQCCLWALMMWGVCDVLKVELWLLLLLCST
jgi:hypothetical protein